MGLCQSRSSRASFGHERDPMMFIQKMKLLQQEISAVLKEREKEKQEYEREMMVFAFKEADWKKEKKQLREEIRRLRKRLQEKEETVKEMEEAEEGSMTGRKSEHKFESEGMSVESGSVASLLLVEQMREERARRDETVEKWKMLYLAIKHELDDLIQRTHQGTLYWRADDKEGRDELQRELQTKDELIQVMKAQIASMEEEDIKRRREVDILRQSLRIVCSKSGTFASTTVANTLS